MQTGSAFNPSVHPVGDVVQAGPWQLSVQKVELGDQALATMATANSANGDGPLDLQWVIAWVQASNTSDSTQIINVSDFSACGAEGILYQSPITMGPFPLLQGIVEPGATIEGGVPFWVGDLSNVLLRFSSPLLGGNWADAWFGLTTGAAILSYGEVPAASSFGVSPSTPATLGQTVRAGDFDVTILRYATGQEAYDLAPGGVRALGPWDIGNWHSFFLTVRNVTNKPRFFSFVALRLADSTGDPWDHLLALSAPQPDVAREIMPGATMEGWASIETQPWATLDLIRVRNTALSEDARFVSLNGVVEKTPDPVLDLAIGDVVIPTMTPLNLRSNPTTTADIVTELDGTSTLTITGDIVEADNYFWYPVKVNTSGESGYVVSNYLELATVD